MSESWNKRPGRSSKWCWPATRAKVYARDGHACVYCGDREHLTLDHVVPRVHGGRAVADNLVTACRTCNSSRQDQPLSGHMLRLARRALSKSLSEAEA